MTPGWRESFAHGRGRAPQGSRIHERVCRIKMVQEAGLEPARSLRPTRPSTLRVYRFATPRWVLGRRLELLQPFGHCGLNAARLPLRHPSMVPLAGIGPAFEAS